MESLATTFTGLSSFSVSVSAAAQLWPRLLSRNLCADRSWSSPALYGNAAQRSVQFSSVRFGRQMQSNGMEWTKMSWAKRSQAELSWAERIDAQCVLRFWYFMAFIGTVCSSVFVCVCAGVCVCCAAAGKNNCMPKGRQKRRRQQSWPGSGCGLAIVLAFAQLVQALSALSTLSKLHTVSPHSLRSTHLQLATAFFLRS